MRSLLPFRRSRRERSKGQSLVEFALLLPMMLIFLAGALDLGRVFYANISLNNAAREGAFEAAESPDSFQKNQPCNTATNRVICRVQLEAKDSSVSIADNNIDMTCSVAGCPGQAGSTVTVEVTGSFTLITPLLSVIFGGQTIPLSSSATAQVLYWPDARLITPPPAPVADFTASPNPGQVLDAIHFDGSLSTGNPTDYQWDFGDGAQAVGQTPETDHTYLLPGDYLVTLTVINLTGVDSQQKTVTITVLPGPPPSAPPSVAPTPSCAFPPPVIGLSPGTAQADIINAGFNVITFADLSSGPKNKIQAQNPDHTQCLPLGTVITIHYRPS